MDKKEAIKELKFEKNISAGVMEQLGTTKALRKIVAIQQKKRTQTYDTAIEALEKQIPIKMKDMRSVNDFSGRYYTCIGTCPICGEENIYRNIVLSDEFTYFRKSFCVRNNDMFLGKAEFVLNLELQD